MKNTIICIPSRSRTDLILKNSGTWKYIREYDGRVYLFVRLREFANYREVLIKTSLDNVEVMLVKDEVNIAQKRDEMLKFASIMNSEYLVMMDDDLTFSKRNEDISSKYETCKSLREDFKQILFESTTLCSNEYPLVGFPARFGAQGRKYMFEKNSPMLYFACYHIPTLVEHNLNFTGLNTAFGEDAYMQLSLLRKGYRSLTNCRFAVGDRSAPRYIEEGGNSGGCHDYRTLQLKEESAIRLSEEFPESVKVQRKENGSLINVRSLNYYLNKGELKYIPKEEVLPLLGVTDEANKQ